MFLFNQAEWDYKLILIAISFAYETAVSVDERSTKRQKEHTLTELRKGILIGRQKRKVLRTKIFKFQSLKSMYHQRKHKRLQSNPNSSMLEFKRPK